MTLRSAIQDLREHADIADDEHQVKVRTGQFAELSTRIAPLLSELPALNAGLIEVSQLNADLPAMVNLDAARVATSLRALADEVATLGIGQSVDLAKERVHSTEKHVKELRALVSDTWQAYVREPVPNVNDDLLDALAEGGVRVEEMRDALENARGLLLAVTSKAIPNRGAVQKYREAIDAIQLCGEQIGDLVGPEIAEGIVGSQESSGMPLTWFTSERIDKLRTLGIINRFRVRLQ